MGDTYTNSIIKSSFKAQNELYHMTFAVKTVENLFTGCGHERNTAIMETDFFFIKSIIKSYMKGNTCSNIILSCLTSLVSSKPIQKRISETTRASAHLILLSRNNSTRKEDARQRNEVHF